MGILEDILASVESTQAQVDRLEAEVRALLNLREPAQTPAPQPAQTIAPAPQPAPSLYAQPAPAAAPAPTTATQVAGPALVPTLEELRERLMTLNEQKGADLCISLLRNHQGANAEGSVNVTFVPQEQYAALYGAINQQLGVH